MHCHKQLSSYHCIEVIISFKQRLCFGQEIRGMYTVNDDLIIKNTRCLSST